MRSLCLYYRLGIIKFVPISLLGFILVRLRRVGVLCRSASNPLDMTVDEVSRRLQTPIRSGLPEDSLRSKRRLKTLFRRL